MAYVLVAINRILDQRAFDEYAERVRPMLKKHGGWWVAIESEPDTLDGQWPFARTVVVEFPSIGLARTWYDSPEYREIIPLRQRAIDANIVILRGLKDAQ